MAELTPERKPASGVTEARQTDVRQKIASGSNDDFEIAERGRIAPGAPRQVPGRFGHAVWDLDSYAFLDDPVLKENPPTTVNPSLWRQSRLNNIAGLFEVAPSIYQVRGMDNSNVTFIAGETGWIVIDPLTAEETASAALALIDEHVGARPIRAVVYTHSHTAHFGGVHGLLSEITSGDVKLIAPAGFLEAAISENVLAGTAMLRRATYMYGALLAHDAQGHVDTGLGKLQESNQQIYSVGKDISRLSELLRAPSFRGGIGELMLENLLSLVRQGDLPDAAVLGVFRTEDQALLHQGIEHLAGGGAGDAQLVADIGDADAVLVDAEQGAELRR